MIELLFILIAFLLVVGVGAAIFHQSAYDTPTNHEPHGSIGKPTAPPQRRGRSTLRVLDDLQVQRQDKSALVVPDELQGDANSAHVRTLIQCHTDLSRIAKLFKDTPYREPLEMMVETVANYVSNGKRIAHALNKVTSNDITAVVATTEKWRDQFNEAQDPRLKRELGELITRKEQQIKEIEEIAKLFVMMQLDLEEMVAAAETFALQATRLTLEDKRRQVKRYAVDEAPDLEGIFETLKHFDEMDELAYADVVVPSDEQVERWLHLQQELSEGNE